jgi:hypothetical protein
MNKEILNSRDVMAIICENTLLEMERDGIIDFRIGNRKRYYLSNVKSSCLDFVIKRLVSFISR